LASVIGADNLLVVWAVGLMGTSALCAAILGVRRAGPRPRLRSRRPSAVAELRQGLAFVRRSSLLGWMSVAAVLFSVLFYSLYLPYAQAATGRFPDPDELAGFFGIFWAAVTAAAFLVSMLLTNRLLGWFGAAAMVLVLPFLYAGAFGVLFAISTFEVLVAVRFAANVWLEGVSNPAWETLVNVTPEDRRDQMRAFLKGGPTQVGTAIAGVVQLIGRGVLTPRQLSAIALDDPLIRASAELARSELSQGGTMTRSQASMSPIEVVLALRRIPLFTALAPADLQRVAEIAKEHTHPDGDVIGTARVVRADGETIARRGPGEVVGELSVIRRAPHVATLIAEGDVRTLHIGYREFEAMVHERPDIALAVMRVLAERLAAMTTEPVESRT
jgi:hypothetical protein